MDIVTWLFKKLMDGLKGIWFLFIRTEPDEEAKERIKNHKKVLIMTGNALFLIVVLVYIGKVIWYFRDYIVHYWFIGEWLLDHFFIGAIVLGLSILVVVVLVVYFLMFIRMILNDYSLFKYALYIESFIAILFPEAKSSLVIIGFFKALLQKLGLFN